MPAVEKTTGGPVYHRGLGETLEIGDQSEVSEELAAYLCEERGDFERVDAGDDSAGTCDVVKSDDEVCGRDLPCPYHSDGDEEG